MAADRFAPEPVDEEISWKELIFGRNNTVWFLLIAFGWLMFELTAQPALVAVAVCSKFGIPDVLNGLWLRRSDTKRRRGKVCFWFCISQGLWKTTVVAFAAMMLYVILSMVLQAGRGGPPAGFVGTAITFLMAFILASLTTLLGVLLARVAGVRIWIDGSLSASRRAGTFPPEPGSSNRVRWLLAGGMILPVVVFLMIALIVAGARRGAVQNALGVLIGLFMLPLGIIAGGLLLARTVVAESWEECWLLESRTGMTLRDLAVQEGVLSESDVDDDQRRR